MIDSTKNQALKRLAATVLIIMHTSGCATVVNRSVEQIRVNSNPAGANAVIECDGGVRAAATTPARIGIPRQAAGCVLSISKDGMAAQRIPLERDISGKYWGALWTGIGASAFLAAFGTNNLGVILFGPVVVYGLGSALIDAATGRRWGHDPDQINVKLEPKTVTP